MRDEQGQGFSARLLSLVMLNVLDEKWKDHLYDLDQLRGAIHYRSWGQKDPLIEYKQEAYTMFVDLMNDIHTTFTERFLRAQLVFNAPPPPPPMPTPEGDGRPRMQKRYNALGVLEEVPVEETAESTSSAIRWQRAEDGAVTTASATAGSDGGWRRPCEKALRLRGREGYRGRGLGRWRGLAGCDRLVQCRAE